VGSAAVCGGADKQSARRKNKGIQMAEKKCENRATLRRIWPGSPPDFVCSDHAKGWLNIAKAMGVNMFLEPIFETDRKCCNMVQSME
jgi:hypothetical protein